MGDQRPAVCCRSYWPRTRRPRNWCLSKGRRRLVRCSLACYSAPPPSTGSKCPRRNLSRSSVSAAARSAPTRTWRTCGQMARQVGIAHASPAPADTDTAPADTDTAPEDTDTAPADTDTAPADIDTAPALPEHLQ